MAQSELLGLVAADFMSVPWKLRCFGFLTS
jgi:hypothetical protein